jgi:formylglycine-generating enzyme required for sulfatase activity
MNRRIALGMAVALFGAWGMTSSALNPRPLDLTATLTMTDIPRAAASTPEPSPVTANADWMPVEQDFNGVTMMHVPAGCFQMGMVDSDADAWLEDVVADFGDDPLWHSIRDRLTPAHEICFEAPFWIDRTEVTQAQFEAFDGVSEERPRFRGEDRPVEAVTWAEAQAFCVLRGARLPTEAEWEYAARGPDGLTYPWGDEFEPDFAVWEENAGDQTADVGGRPDGASWVGAVDMAGNVWEWTSTAYDSLDRSGLYPYPYTDDGREDADQEDVLRVVRGGSWFFLNETFLRSAVRDGNDPATRATVIGFRCARDGES